MQENRQSQKQKKRLPLAAISIVAVLLSMLTLLWFNTSNSQQSLPAFYPDLYFEGQYQIGDGPWKTVEAGQHISSTQGDVTLVGKFHMVGPDGEYLAPAEAGMRVALYINHIHISITEPGQPVFDYDIENELVSAMMCGEHCLGYELGTNEPVTLKIHNPHRFGNENAVDQLLQELSVYADSAFEKDFAAQGDLERNVGLVLVIAAFVLLGTALFSSLLRIAGSGRLWLIGLCVFFAGSYFIYSAKGVSFESNSIIGNTTILGGSMMLYMLCICGLITMLLRGNRRKLALAAVSVMGAFCTGIAVLCLTTDIHFYDSWLWWAVIQSIVNALLLVCLAMNFANTSRAIVAGNIGAALLLLGFETDFIATAFGWWQGGLVSGGIFLVLFAVAMFAVWQLIPRKMHDARKASEMEKEQKLIRAQLQETRIAIMISQIQPHFIYNTLGTIQQLCKEDPERAAQLVHRFSLYLRGNFSELDNTAPIRFLQELEHVRCYTEIELVRFPDMTVVYDIQTGGFLLPALTVQPLVENAIKHGLMGLEQGGTVTISAYETATHYCVKVIDDGVGFDAENWQDDRKHIGIRNVRERLQIMCGGTLTVESRKGEGTCAWIQIPKEEKK